MNRNESYQNIVLKLIEYNLFLRKVKRIRQGTSGIEKQTLDSFNHIHKKGKKHQYPREQNQKP